MLTKGHTVGGMMKRCMSTKTWSDSVEALRYTQESKAKQNMLDRSRVYKKIFYCLTKYCLHLFNKGFLTAKNYSYRIVGTDDIDRANALLYDTYHPDEPLNKHLGLTAGKKSQSCNENSSKTLRGLCKGSIIERECCLMLHL